MNITGAVLEEVGRPGPWAETTPLTVGELELEGPPAGEVLVQVEAAGVCHSDLSVVDGNRPRPVPMLLGHEACGRVTELGAGVTDLRVGQRVVMTFLPRCGHCAGCATDASHYYDATTDVALQAAFRDIALKISTLRLTN